MPAHKRGYICTWVLLLVVATQTLIQTESNKTQLVSFLRGLSFMVD